MSNLSPLHADRLDGHQRRLRAIAGGALAAQLLLAAASWALPRLRTSTLSPAAVTMLLAACCLWLAFRAGRDADAQVAHLRHGYSVHGDAERLLRGHVMVYLAVLGRLLAISAAGLAVAAWGLGPGVGLAFIGLSALLMVLAWPTPHKTRLLVDRAEAARREVSG